MQTAANSYDHTTLSYRSDSSESPSFDSYSSGNNLANIAARVINEFKDDEDGNPYDEIFCSSSTFPQSYAIHHMPQDKSSTPLQDKGRRNDRDVKHTPHDQSPADHVESVEIKPHQTKKPKIQDDNTSIKPNKEDNNDEEESESEFEFAIPVTEDGSSPISADEIFQNGQIRPLFPLFNINLIHANTRYDSTSLQPFNHSTTSDTPTPLRLPLKKLLIEDRDPTSCSSSETDELDGVAPDTYCVWTPNQSNREVMNKKSNSTGSSSKRWRLRHFLHRSHSDGSREPFFTFPERGNKEEQHKQRRNSSSSLLGLESKTLEQQRKGKAAKEKKLPPISAAKGSNSYMDKNWAEKKADRRKKSYLPYRQDLLGFFSGVNGSV